MAKSPVESPHKRINSGGTSQGDPVPTEEVSFNYGTIAWTYTESGNSGSTGGDSESDWDISSNEGV